MDTKKKAKLPVVYTAEIINLAFEAMLAGAKLDGMEKTIEELRAGYKLVIAGIKKAVKVANWPGYARQVREKFKADYPKATESDLKRFTGRLSYLRKACGYPAANGGNPIAQGPPRRKPRKPAVISDDPATLVIPKPAGKTPEAQGRLVLQVLDKLQFRLGMDIDTFVLVVHSALGSIAKREKKTV